MVVPVSEVASPRVMEKVQQNPNEHSREQLYTWLRKHDFTITSDGDLVGYKGVYRTFDDDASVERFRSISTGTAIVDGRTHTGHIPNYIGAVVEMPRSQVAHNPNEGCSTGLHVGTYEYAQSYAQGALLECHVSPRDVVSVPTDCDAQKMRVCRYRVVNVIDQKIPVGMTAGWEDEDYDDEDYEDDGV